MGAHARAAKGEYPSGTDSSPVVYHCLSDYFIRDMRRQEREKGCAGAGGDGKVKRGETSSFSFPFLLPIIPCFISLLQLTPAPFRDRVTTAVESASGRSLSLGFAAQARTRTRATPSVRHPRPQCYSMSLTRCPLRFADHVTKKRRLWGRE